MTQCFSTRRKNIYVYLYFMLYLVSQRARRIILMMFENIMFKYFGIKNLVPFLLIMSIKWIGKIKLEYNDEKSVEIYEKRHLIPNKSI